MFGSVNYIHYLCIDNVEEMSGWGNNTSWSVDSNLLYILYKGPHLLSEETFVYVKCYSYICIMETILMILFYMVVSSTILIGGSVMVLKHFPTSKMSKFIRKNLITDEDLEPKN